MYFKCLARIGWRRLREFHPVSCQRIICPIVQRHYHTGRSNSRLATGGFRGDVGDLGRDDLLPGGTDWDAPSLVRRLMSQLTELERVHVVSEGELVESVLVLRDVLSASPRQCLSLLAGCRDLLQTRPFQLRRLAETLLELSMAPACVLACLKGGEQLLACWPAHLTSVMDLLMQHLEATEPEVHAMLAAAPLVLCRRPRELRRQFSQLRGFFSRQQTTAVVLRSPLVLLETPDVTGAKIDYLNREMCLSSDEVARSDGMGASLALLRARHTFLYRLGAYTPVSLKSTAPNRNPPLSSIANMSDSDFCSKIARARCSDYEVFCRLIEDEISAESEQQQEEEDDLSSDEEDMDDTPED